LNSNNKNKNINNNNENTVGEDNASSNQNKTNEHGIAHRRGFTMQAIQPIPDLRSGLNSPPSSASSSGRPPFQGQ
jgi:hypothetical protein